jgi:hypothetical protein
MIRLAVIAFLSLSWIAPLRAQVTVLAPAIITAPAIVTPASVWFLNCSTVQYQSVEFRCQVVAPAGLWPQESDGVYLTTDTPINGALPPNIYLDPAAGVAYVPYYGVN